MIWRQDGDPPHTRRGWKRCLYEAPGGGPLVQELWRATAHETADMVCQILSGDGRAYGLGHYRSLWRNEEAEAPNPKPQPLTKRERARMEEADQIMAAHRRIHGRILRTNEKISELEHARFFTDRDPKGTKKELSRLRSQKAKQLKQLRLVRAWRIRFNRNV